MTTKVKIGIIGIGTIGSVHVNAYAKNKNAEVAALCDINRETLEAKAQPHSIGLKYD